jgi:predicted metal-dependent phosphoesterase TrpH
MISARVAAHVHSSWSYDAQWSLPDIATAFRRHRYDVVLMAEHDRGFDEHKWAEYQLACQEASTGGILLVPGIEYEDPDSVVHIPVWGEAVPFLGAGRPTLELLRCARDQNAISVLAHPWRRNAVARYQPEWGRLLSAIEIWNRKYDGVAPSRPLRQFADREGIDPFASLDFHTRRQFYPLAMSVTLAAEPSTASLVEAIRQGHGRPEFLGRPALRFTEGIAGAALRSLEIARRGVRRPIRRLPIALIGNTARKGRKFPGL